MNSLTAAAFHRADLRTLNCYVKNVYQFFNFLAVILTVKSELYLFTSDGNRDFTIDVENVFQCFFFLAIILTVKSKLYFLTSDGNRDITIDVENIFEFSELLGNRTRGIYPHGRASS